ncbi:low molecular weight phosphatase family protein [Natronococcus pandeyae]|uniref:Low molecular weight phosphatase family protein n=1 Tax=Natronococcus pandeyae TaxID=2055836 RepID=A0A8J8Q3Z0_9EURY|nr:low molecular weight phosphatase family protein [Natronococcus pandeyae]TYL39001.1 low molecular weight phosphatase family protein [Natronococcus pandeyae]
MSDEPTTVALVCVQNAGRSQMATAYAERERDARDLTDAVEILSGGTHPAESVHDVVLEAMHEAGFDLSDRTPAEITESELEACDYVATMGCSTLELDADTDVRDWDLEDPHGRELETVHEIREDVKARVEALFDEIEAGREE